MEISVFDLSSPVPFEGLYTYDENTGISRLRDILGTHIHAPASFIPQGRTLDQIEAVRYVNRAMCVDISQRTKEFDFVTEKQMRSILPEGYGGLFADEDVNAVLFYTRPYYQKGGQAHPPYLSPEAAEYLMHNIPIRLIAIDTPSIGPPGNNDTHIALLERGILIVEQIGDLGDLMGKEGLGPMYPPSRNFLFVCTPAPYQNVDAAPTSAIAITGSLR